MRGARAPMLRGVQDSPPVELGAQLRSLRPDRSALAIRAYRGARRAAERLGIQFVVKSFYSPIPELRALPPDAFERTSPLHGLDLRLDRQVALVEDELAPYLAEFEPPRRPTGRPGEFHLDNGSYPPVDADLLYALVRYLKPRRVLELGSGHSTLVTCMAAAANRRQGYPARVECFDPHPSVVAADTPGLTRLEPLPAQQVTLAEFEALGPGDVLFVDTTHTVKLGSDVNFVVLDVLPLLARGVVVHFHDVFLPREYPRSWIEDLGLIWAEQYLLQAFLAMNPGYEILLSANALAAEHPDELGATVRSWPHRGLPGAFWIRRTG